MTSRNVGGPLIREERAQLFTRARNAMDEDGSVSSRRRVGWDDAKRAVYRATG